MKIYKRLIEKIINQQLESSGAIHITGPKFCGKSTTCRMFAKSSICLASKKIISNVQLEPSLALQGEAPRLIDEWQSVPDIWNYVKLDLDKQYQFGKYILTGSSTPINKEDIYHSGAGRISNIKMSTLSLIETGESSGKYSLLDLFNNKINIKFEKSPMTLSQLAYYMCRGGWPLSLQGTSQTICLNITKNYVDNLFQHENKIGEVFRDLDANIMKRTLMSWARNISSEADKNTIITDVLGKKSSPDYRKMDSYVNALKDLYLIYDLYAWSPKIRSKTAIRSSPVHHFVDTSIALAILKISPNDLLNDINSFGLFFEDFVLHELMIYSQFIDGELRHYRDAAGLECDCVIHLPNGKWAPVEIKLGGEEAINTAIKKLRLLKEKITTKSDLPGPSFMLIIIAVGYSAKTKDGIYIIPIDMLKN